MLVFSPRTQLCQYGYPQVMLAWLSSGGNERARRRPGYGDIMYILCLLVFFSLGGPMSFEFFALAPILLPVAVNSHIPLTDYKSPKDPPSISHPPLPRCPRVPQMPTFVGLPIPWEHCQPALGIKFTRDYPILSSNLTLGMWRFTLHNASNITPYV